MKMKIHIGHLVKYSLFLAYILLSYLIYYYSSKTSIITLPSSGLQSSSSNQAISAGTVHVIAPFIISIPEPKPDPNELIILFYIGVLGIISATIILNQIRKGHAIPIQN